VASSRRFSSNVWNSISASFSSRALNSMPGEASSSACCCRFTVLAGTVRYQFRRALLPLALWYTRRIYRRLARETAAQIADYQKSGVAVLGIVGVDASPSCGVGKSLNMREALDRVGHLEGDTASAEDVNLIVRSTVTPGQGLYIDLLRREMAKRGVSVPLMAHDLIDELDGKRSSVDVRSLLPVDRK
jgi:hypothetical protein